MKIVLLLIGLTLTYSASADLIDNNCSAGNRGWWLKLETPTHNRYVDGGISTTTGNYTGCGTCDQCRFNLNQIIDELHQHHKTSCLSRGGEIKSVSRGTWRENIQSANWYLYAESITSTCEKWIPCY